jgi:hypothetical protein
MVWKLDARANFNHVKFLTFEVCLTSPPAFHVLLSTAASDIAALHGRHDSKEAIMHIGMAISGVGKALVKQGGGVKMRDENITAVGMLAGNGVSRRVDEDRICC